MPQIETPVHEKDAISAAGLLASLPRPSTEGTTWSPLQLAQFVALVTQQIEFAEAHPHLPREIRGSLINNLVIPRILEFLRAEAPQYSWKTGEMSNERRAKIGSGFSVGQVPAVDDTGIPLGYTCLGGTYRVHEAGDSFEFSVGYLLTPQVSLLSAEAIAESDLSYASRIARAQARPPDLCALQAPAASSPGRWLAQLQSQDGITPYWLCGGIAAPPTANGALPAIATAPLGVFSEAVYRELRARGYSHALLPFSRRDPATFAGQTGRYFTFDPSNLTLDYQGDVLDGQGRLTHVRLSLRAEIVLFTDLAQRALRKASQASTGGLLAKPQQ